MLNRHAIVLFLGLAAMELVHPLPIAALPTFGVWFLLLLIGLLLDTGHPSPRTTAAHGLQLLAVVVLVAAVVWAVIRAGAAVLPQALANVGIALAVVGLMIEMRGPYRSLRGAVAIHALGDVLFLAGFALAFLEGIPAMRSVGWVFVAIAGLLSLYAAISNLVLQLARLKNLQAGWRFRLLQVDRDGLSLQTPSGIASLPWRDVRALKRLDERHLILVLPSPLPPEVARAGLPLEELRQSAEAPAPGPHAPPEAFGFILHEQEMGRSLPDAEAWFRQEAPASLL